MSKPYVPSNPNSLVQQAIQRAGGISALAAELGLSAQTVSAWAKKDRITRRYMLKVSHLADIPPLDLISYVERAQKPWYFKPAKVKTNAPDALVALQKGEITLGQCVLRTNLTPRTIKQTLTIHGDRLPLVKETLEGDLPNTLKAARLGVTTRQLNRLISAYLPKIAKPEHPRVVQRKQAAKKWAQYRAQAVRVIRGGVTVNAAAEEIGLSGRQLHRWIDKTLVQRFSVNLRGLATLPRPFRIALSIEAAEEDHPEVATHLIDFWKRHNLMSRPMPAAPETWKRAPIRRCLIAILTGEASLRDIAAARDTKPELLKPLLTSHLSPLAVGFEQVETWKVAHQEALAEILNSLGD